ncbi:MAG: CotH kinase family protein [Leadbetterella sp.]
MGKLVLLLLISFSGFSQVVISEIMASNASVQIDQQGNSPDWIEVYNGSDQEIDLADYSVGVSKKDKNLIVVNKGILKVPVKGYRVVMLGENQYFEGQKEINLSKNDGRVYLFQNGKKKYIHRISYGTQRTDFSYGLKNGTSTCGYFAEPTPGKANQDEIFKGFTKKPEFSRTSGYATVDFSLNIKSKKSTIFYTTDGSTPMPEGKKTFITKDQYAETGGNPASFSTRVVEMKTNEYSSPIAVKNKIEGPNFLGNFNSTFLQNPGFIPSYSIRTGNTLKAVAQKKGYLPSEVVERSYIVNDKPLHKFPVVSLTIKPEDFFDYRYGIYVAGQDFDNFRLQSNEAASICTPGNYKNTGEEWERTAQMQYYIGQVKLLDESIQVRINGGCTRSMPYKSLRLISDTKFEKKINLKGSEGIKMSHLILRNGGNDNIRTQVNDVFTSKLMSNLRLPCQGYQPAILLLNGEYWGIHELRERTNEEFIEVKTGVGRNEIDMINIVFYGPEEVQAGDINAYNDLKKYFKETDFSNDKNYEEALNRIDIDNFIDFQIAHIFTGNVDWPQNNVKLWRKRTSKVDVSSNKPSDGRWRWIFYDGERGFGEVFDVGFNNLKRALEMPENFILGKLAQNDKFKKRFSARFLELLKTTFKTENTLALHGEFVKEFEPEMPEHIRRWKSIPSMETWRANIENVKNYLRVRPTKIPEHIAEVWGWSYANSVSLKSWDGGRISVDYSEQNSDWVFENQSKEVIYSQSDSLILRAESDENHRFVFWLIDSSYSRSKELYVSKNNPLQTIDAIFVSNDIADSEFEDQLKFENLKASPSQVQEIYLESMQGRQVEFITMFDKNGKEIPFNHKISFLKKEVIHPEEYKKLGAKYYRLKLVNDPKVYLGYLSGRN